MIKEVIDDGYASHVSSGKFSISGIGGCMRTKYFTLWKKYKQDFDNKTQRIFAIGDFVHRQCVSSLMTNGPSHGMEVVASEINIPEMKYLSGRLDCVVSILESGERIIIDFKSCGRWTLNKVKEGDVSTTYKDQVNLYMHIFGIHKGYLFFMCKDNSETVEYEVVYDKERAVQQIKEIEDFFVNYVHKGIMPPKCDGGIFGCNMCGVKTNNEGNKILFSSKFDTMKAQDEIQKYLNNGGTYEDLYKK